MPQRPSPRAMVIVVAFGVFIAADDLTVVSTMLRQIIFDLSLPLPDDLDRAAWIVNAYLIAYVVVMPFVGRLSDLLGRRPVYVGALGLFLAGSVWVPLAPDYNSFLVGRVLTALGGGAMVPVAMAVIGDVFPRGERATALGTLGAVDTAGWVWGPLYGALLVRYLSWRWQFYLNIPLSLAGMAAAWWALRDLPRPAPADRGRIDWAGAALLSVALLMLNLALLRQGDAGSAGGFAQLSRPDPAATLPLYLLAALALVLFVALQRRSPTAGRTRPGAIWRRLAAAPPLIDLRLFGRPNFATAGLINFLVGGVLIIAMVNVPLLINVVTVDVSQAALRSGGLLSGMTGAMAAAAYAGGRLTARWGYRRVTAAGLALVALGFGLMGGTWQLTSPTAVMAAQLVLLGVGFGLVIAPVGAAVINAAPDDQRGVAASLVIVLRLMGMSVGLSGLTAWGLRRFDALRVQIQLPDLPLTDPAYQQAIVDGLTGVTFRVLAETFLISAGVAVLALLAALRLRDDAPDG